MGQEETDYLNIVFDRANSKYNRLWNQLGSLIIFFIGTLFLLVIYMSDARTSLNQNVLVLLILLLSLVCASGGLWIWYEMRHEKRSINTILFVFEKKHNPRAKLVLPPGRLKPKLKFVGRIVVDLIYYALIIFVIFVGVPLIIQSIITILKISGLL